MFSSRGVQYVHCVMHKCIMVKVGRGIWESRGNERFGGNRGNWGERTKIGGNFKFVTKKGHKNLEIFQRSLRNFSEMGGGNLKHGEMDHGLRGMEGFVLVFFKIFMPLF